MKEVCMSIGDYLEMRGEEVDAWWRGWEESRRLGVSWGGWYELVDAEYVRRQAIVLDYLRWVRSNEVVAGWVSGGGVEGMRL